MIPDAEAIAAPMEEQLAAVQRIAESAVFRRSPRLREMLLYIVGHTLTGGPDDLTETRIAENVFHRHAYNSAQDNLVRVSARQLRTKLAEYYSSEGNLEEIVFDIPKGGYRAVLRTHEESPFRIPEGGTGAIPVLKHRIPLWHWLLPLLSGGMLCLLLASVHLYSENRRLRAVVAQSNAPQTLFEPILPNGWQRTHIVVTDSALVLLEQLAHQNPSLESYADNAYLQLMPSKMRQGAQADFFRCLSTRQISSLADMRIVSSIYRSYPKQARDISLRHARNMHARDFDNNDNFLLIGSSRSNPWATLFERSLNFQFQPNFGESCFENRRPLPGEQQQYCSATGQGTDYAHIVMMHNGGRKGRVVLIAGIAMEGTEAAGAFFMDPASLPEVLQRLHAKHLSDVTGYELLLKVYDVGGSGRSAEIVAARRQ